MIAHLEIRSIAPARAVLPIASMGYRSRFHEIGTIAANGGDVGAQAMAWLDDEALRTEWRAHVNRSNQGELF